LLRFLDPRLRRRAYSRLRRRRGQCARCGLGRLPALSIPALPPLVTLANFRGPRWDAGLRHFGRCALLGGGCALLGGCRWLRAWLCWLRAWLCCFGGGAPAARGAGGLRPGGRRGECP